MEPLKYRHSENMTVLNQKNMYTDFFSPARLLSGAARRSLGAGLLMLGATAMYAQEVHLSRSLENLPVVTTEISTETAHYQPVFGMGDRDSATAEGVRRFGCLTIDPEGSSHVVNYGREELVYYVLDGKGTIHYAGQDYPITKADFFYLPIGTEHGFSNDRPAPLTLMVMGFPVPTSVKVEPTAGLKLANADDVSFQVLEQGHGPTSRYKLLLGPTDSNRDRLATAYQIKSFYIIDFEPGGTNKVHRHKDEEEIYFMLQGHGEMVAGESPGGKEKHYPVKGGDAYFFSRNSPVGFFSGTGEGEKHAQILAIRSKYPHQQER